MKVNNRNIVTLLVVVFILIGYFSYTYIIIPLESTVAQSVAEYDNIRNIFGGVSGAILDESHLKKKITNLKIKVDLLDQALPSHIYQEETLVYIMDMIEKYDINITNISFTEEDNEVESSVEGKYYGDYNSILDKYMFYLEGDSDIDPQELMLWKKKANDEKDDETGEEIGDIDDYIEYLTIDFSFKARYLDFKKMINTFESSDQKIIVTAVSMSKDASALNVVNGTFSLKYPFYYHNEKIEELEWQIEKQFGKPDPFYYKVKNQNISVNSYNDSKTSDTVNSDFGMLLSSLVSDRASVIIGKTPLRYTEIYADNAGVEEVNMYLIDDRGTLKFRYDTSVDSFPGQDEYMEFTPYGKKIVMNVYSSARGDDDDKAGALLNAHNSTGLELEIHIYDDDQKRPRFEVVSQEGMVKTIGH